MITIDNEPDPRDAEELAEELAEDTDRAEVIAWFFDPASA